ncbi:S8 family serine peptidase [Fervidibacillus albus]|uniref:S8 family serine peptidase n=2 Tax=Fervidibacillus albus TaxID=2980026 RepID=A0A9E8LZ41_9BACI|nr:S8 family serine peptidase [Fervidibacillus albus]
MTDEKGERLTGKGIKVGIIDTGIDYTHPDLFRNYEKGYDFVDRDEDPLEKDVGTIHGTHVAGIIAANGKMVGMAPDARLYVYRALGADGRGTTEQILAAIDQAIKDGVDILNLSLGIQINGPDLPTSIAIDAAVKRGIVAVVSSGNAGPHLWTVGSPGTSQKAISVGASTPPLKIPYLEYRGSYFPLKTIQSFGRWDFFRSYPLRHENDYKGPETNGDALVLVEKGGDLLSEKIKMLADEGVKGAIVTGYSEEELGTYVNDFQSSIPISVYALSEEDGHILKDLMKRKTFARLLWKREEDVLAPFSSRGPVPSTWNIKPDLLAPGVSITSTVPGGYLTLHGTSMAAPHVTGACALLKQKHPDWSPEKIKAVLMNTSTLLQENRYKTFEQGAGRIRVDEAFRTETIVEPGAIVFGKATENTFEKTSASVTVENISEQPIRYTFHYPNGEDNVLWDFPPPFYLKPGEKKTIDLSVRLKTFSKTKEMEEGYIEMNAGKQTFRIPYLYVINEPNYPRIMFFTVEGNKRGTIRYEMYLPGGAEQLWIILLDPLTGGVIRYIKEEKGVHKGLSVKEIELKEAIPPGTYLAIAIAKKSGREDYLQQWVDIPMEE